MIFSRVLLVASSLLLAIPAYAGNPDEPWNEEAPDGVFCKENPATCEQARINREALKKRCETEPAHCEALKAERSKRVEKRRARQDERRERRESRN